MEFVLTSLLSNNHIDESIARKVIDSLPAIVYINELQNQGDSNSCRNIWINKTGLDLLGYTQEEITQMGSRFFKEILHPDDLEILPISVECVYAENTTKVQASLQRIKFNKKDNYEWYYGHGVVLENFDDGSPRKLLVVAMNITEPMFTNHQLLAALQEVNYLKNRLKISLFTKREKEILRLIAEGKTDKFISEQLFISIKTAKKHRNNMIHKAQVKNTAELIALVAQMGELPINYIGS